MVRAATAEDARAIAELHVRAWQTAYRGILPPQLLGELSVDLRERSWREALETPAGVTVVADADEPGRPLAGFCALALPGRDDDAGERTAEVTATYVDPARWQSGIGRSLLGTALGSLDAGAWDDVTLWVFLRNAQARAFYARSGFRLDGAKVDPRRQRRGHRPDAPDAGLGCRPCPYAPCSSPPSSPPPASSAPARPPPRRRGCARPG